MWSPALNVASPHLQATSSPTQTSPHLQAWCAHPSMASDFVRKSNKSKMCKFIILWKNMFSFQIKIFLFLNQEINVYFHWLMDWLILVIMIKSLFVIEIEEDMFQHWRVRAIAPLFNFSISRLSGTDRLSEMRICNVAARSTSDLITIRGWPGNRPIFMQRRNILLWTCQIYHKAW